MNLCEYLKRTDDILKQKEQKEWSDGLAARLRDGMRAYINTSGSKKRMLIDEFLGRVRTEEIKAWYSSPEGNSLFQGTSISSLTIPCELDKPLEFRSIADLEERVADSYIKLHRKHAAAVRGAILEDVSEWIKEGLYYGVVLGSKIVSQAFGLSVKYTDAVFEVGGRHIDPHEIMSYPDHIKRAYFKECIKRFDVFKGIKLKQKEFESSLVLADISKPKIKKYKDRIILAPVRCNEIAAVFASRVTDLIAKKTGGAINPKSLAVVIYDTDTPYTYHRIMEHTKGGVPMLPGLIVLGSSGTIDAFRWLYAYRLSLVTQKMMKSSLYSETCRRFIPFVFFGVLVPRDAEILLDMSNLSRLRYPGNIDPEIEFVYLVKGLLKQIVNPSPVWLWSDFKKRIQYKPNNKER